MNWTWKPEDYDNARAGDIAMIREYWALTAPMVTERADEQTG